MRLPLLLAWSCAVSLYVAACSSFTESEASPTADGGADAQTTADGAAPDDDGGARSFCGRSAGAVFCDDFEQPQRSATVAAPWARITGPSANALSLVPGFDSPRALAVISAFPVNTALTIATPIVRTGRDRIRFRFRLDRLVGSSGGALPHLAFASFRFPSDKYLTFFVANEDLDGFISSNIVDAQAITSFEKPPLGLQLGAWNDLRVDIEHIGTTDEFRLYVGDELLAKRREVADGSTTFQLGADVSVVSATVELAFDDVLVTTF